MTLVKEKIKHGKRVHLLGCPIDALSLDETIRHIHRIIESRTPIQHCVVNAGKFVLMEKEPELKKIVSSCSMINADGQSVVWALKLLGRPIPERVTGIDIMERLFEESNQRKYRVYFLGASQHVLKKVIQIVKNNFPDLVVAGHQNGYFKEEENDQVLQRISESQADILFVAMGSPKKEYWLAKHVKMTNVPFCMGVGGSFDVVAGRAKRAPRWIQNIGMEWFFRFIQEPLRLWRRYLLGNLIFVRLVLATYFKKNVHLDPQSKEELSQKEIT